MRVRVFYTEQSLREALRSQPIRIVEIYRVVHHSPAVLVFTTILVAAIVNLVRQVTAADPEWQPAIGLMLCSLVAPVWAVFKYRSGRKRRAAQLSKGFPQVLEFTAQGIETIACSGDMAFAAWNYYSEFRIGNALLYLKLANSRSRRLIPVDGLTEQERGQIRSILLAHIPETRH